MSARLAFDKSPLPKFILKRGRVLVALKAFGPPHSIMTQSARSALCTDACTGTFTAVVTATQQGEVAKYFRVVIPSKLCLAHQRAQRFFQPLENDYISRPLLLQKTDNLQ